MQQELTLAIVTGLITMMGWGLADFFAKKTIDEVGSIVSLVWAHIFGTAVIAVVVLGQVIFLKTSITIPGNIETWGLLLFFGALQAIVYFFAYEGFGKGQIAVLNPVFASYSGFAALVSIIVFRETVSTHVILALIIIFFGILLLSVDVNALFKKTFKFGLPGLKEVGIAAILAAFWTVFWSKSVNGKDWLSYALFMYGFMTLTVILISKFKGVKLGPIKKSTWKFFFLIGFCETIAYMAISLGFSKTNYTSVIALIAGAFSLPTMVLARVFLKEKVTRWQTIASLIIVVGIIVVSL